MKRLWIIGVFLLVGCGPSEEERHQQFAAQCYPAFTKPQCEVLWSVKKSSDDAQASANFSAAMSGAAMGNAAARK